MRLAIIISKGAKNEEGRICTESQIADVLRFLGLLGISEWELDIKGDVRLYHNGAEVYIAIGPLNHLDRKEFVIQANSEIKKGQDSI